MQTDSVATIVEIAEARAAFDVAWSQIKAHGRIIVGHETSRKEWLARIVRGLCEVRPGQDVAPLALKQFFATVPM
ncbi:hypothetical protein AB4099_32455 [Bosea sp. 2KB_26]|uniref:hypothetical protein n=1 Tax=Bosea sp. 2KB_26 TaxID=3237475 RepID=UPI003F90BB5C